MGKPSIRTVAIAGTGVIGRSWIQVFARAGCRVRAYDPDPERLATAREWLHDDLSQLRHAGRIKKKAAEARAERVTFRPSLREAVEGVGVGWVQESGPEDLETKRAIHAELDRVAPPDAILGSSTSALDMTEIAAGLPGAWRAIVAHPVNPPHVIPVVEILGGQATAPDVVRRSILFMRELGQTPVELVRFVPGFILNRLQAALIREAVDLVASGVAGIDAIDATIRDGLGLRWALMGPFGVANTNADGGIREYFTRFRPAYHGLWDRLNTTTRFTDELVERIGRETDEMAPAPLEVQRAWRDRTVQSIRALKTKRPLPGSAASRTRSKPGKGK